MPIRNTELLISEAYISDVSFTEKMDKSELWILHVTVTGVEVETTKCLFGLCDCTVDTEFGTCDFERVWIRARAIACVSGHGLKKCIAKTVVDQNTVSGLLRRRKSENFIAFIS